MAWEGTAHHVEAGQSSRQQEGEAGLLQNPIHKYLDKYKGFAIQWHIPHEHNSWDTLSICSIFSLWQALVKWLTHAAEL